jgi:hypothetical protein
MKNPMRGAVASATVRRRPLPWVASLVLPAAATALVSCGVTAPQAESSEESRRTRPTQDVRLFVSEDLVLEPETNVIATVAGTEVLGPLPGDDTTGDEAGEPLPDPGTDPGTDPATDDGVPGDGEPAPDDGVPGDGEPAPDDGVPGDGEPAPDDGSADGGDGEPLPTPEPTPAPTPAPEPDPTTDPDPQPDPTPVPEPTPAPTPAPDGDDGEDRSACAKEFGVSAERIHIAGQHNDVTIATGSVVYIKVTGNQNTVTLNLEGDDGARIEGLCIFLAGNQPEIKVNANVAIGRIVYIGRGNQSHGSINVAAGCSVDDVQADLAGNQSQLVVEGDGDFKCTNGKSKGNKPDLRCLK